MKNYVKTWFPLLVALLLWLPANSQHDHNWTSGTVQVNFPAGGPPFTGSVTAGLAPTFWSIANNFQEGVASISDAAGGLLFYSNGEELFDAGGGTIGTPPLLGNMTSAQTATILPRPGNCDEYVLITMDASGSGGGANYYYFNAAGFFGPGTAPPNMELPLLDNLGNPVFLHEGVGVVPHPNCVDYWIITHAIAGDEFLVYRLTPTGIIGAGGIPEQPFRTISLGINLLPSSPALGNLMGAGMIKASREGDKVAMTSFIGGVQVLDFDPITGNLSNAVDITPPVAPPAMPDPLTSRLFYYGIEFSRNGDFLFVSRLAGLAPATPIRGMILNYDVSNPVPVALGVLHNSVNWISTLQRGTDGDIYFPVLDNAGLGLAHSLGLIPDSDIGGGTVNENFVDLSTLGGDGLGYGLPAIYDYPTPEIEVTDDDSCDLEVLLCELNMRCRHDSDYAVVLDYQWDFGDGTTATTTDTCIQHEFPGFGDYTVVITVDDPRFCSPQTDTILVSINSCCPANPDFEYPEDTTLTEETYWDGKVLIGANATVTVPTGVTLDITNTDVLFDLCGRIVLEDGAILRANNSVFRPCVDHHAWRGIIFQGSAYGIINECTFKNAITALSFEGPTATARISNNLFTDCKVSILMDSVEFSEGITGNTFQTEDSGFEYDNFDCFSELPGWLAGVPGVSTANAGHLGIAVHQSTVFGKISQNDFINVEDVAANPTTPKLTFGIYMAGSTAEITSNHFSGMSTSIFTSAQPGFPDFATVIENNVMEVNLGNQTSENQIVLAAVSHVQVLGNTITNSQPPLVGNNAIFTLFSSNVRINSNRISGFGTGIRTHTGMNQSITENTILKCAEFGVRLDGSDQIRVGCNVINMELALDSAVTSQRTGIAVNQDLGAVLPTSLVEIHSNCIFETDTAISVVNHVPSAASFDWITNNYLYNYRVAGVHSNGYTVNLGTGPAFADAGRNTFAGNHLFAADLMATGTTPISATGNYGIQTTAGPVTVFAADDFHSFASCGHQIDNALDDVGEELLEEELCDRFWEDHELIFPAKANAANRMKAMDLIVSEMAGSGMDAGEVDLLMRNWEAIQSMEDAQYMDQLAQSEKPLALLASLFLNKAYWWYPISSPPRQVKVAVRSELVYLSRGTLEVFPNPAHDQLTIRIADSKMEKGHLEIYDAMGRQIHSLGNEIVAGEISIDVGALIPGVYFVKIKDAAGAQLTERFVVQ